MYGCTRVRCTLKLKRMNSKTPDLARRQCATKGKRCNLAIPETERISCRKMRTDFDLIIDGWNSVEKEVHRRICVVICNAYTVSMSDSG